MFLENTVNIPLIIIIILVSLSFLVLNLILGILVIINILIIYLVNHRVAKKLFYSMWRRTDKNQFERKCSNESIDYHLDMYNQGLAWRDINKEYRHKVSIVSDGFKLYGEYYDFGNKKTVIIIPGRSETCYYGAYYGEVFKKNGYNYLTFDQRSHGISEGIYNTIGINEHRDIIAWSKYLQEKSNQETIVLYGICSGATCACFTLTSPDCPSFIKGFISDGMYYSFFETFREHIKQRKKPVYPVIWHFFRLFKKYAHVNPYSAAPSKMVQNIRVPMLLINGEDDIFALPKYAKKLYEKAGSSSKTLALIHGARHSHTRYDNKPEFDYQVSNFLHNIK